MSGFEVDPAALEAQATAIETSVTSRLQECLDAAKQADADENGQYGVLMTPFAWPIMEGVAGQAQQGIEGTLALSEALTQATLKGISQCYVDIDAEIGAALDKIAQEVEG
jgi:hypothetical protein